jgi:hypothetical protein
MFHAGILHEGLEDFDPFSFRRARYRRGGTKKDSWVKNARIVHPQLIAKLEARE